jgi:hypothetical protein
MRAFGYRRDCAQMDLNDFRWITCQDKTRISKELKYLVEARIVLRYSIGQFITEFAIETNQKMTA